jgi:hypothetical protein
MLYQLHTGWVRDYNERQDPIIYLVSTVQKVLEAGLPFVFSNGHGIAAYTAWFDSAGDLPAVDWNTVYAKVWRDSIDDMDRQRRKQAEFLVHQFCPWSVIESIAVCNRHIKEHVEVIFSEAVASAVRPVIIKTEWYY